MKMLTLVVLLLVFVQVSFSQLQPKAYKLDEFEKILSNCDISARYDGLRAQLKASGASGMIAIYTGPTRERIGNILAYKKSAEFAFKEYLAGSTESVEIIILEGKEFFNQELWIIPKGSKPPYDKSLDFDLSKIAGRHHFSRACLECESNYPNFSSVQPAFYEYAQILRRAPHLRGEVIVNNYAELTEMRKLLTMEHQIPRTRYSIKLKRSKGRNDTSLNVDLYLLAKPVK